MTVYVAGFVVLGLIYWAFRSRGVTASGDPSIEAARTVVGHTNAMRDEAILKETARRMATAPDVAAEVDRIFAPLAPRPQAAPTPPKD